jgi:ferrous iron transport protein B
MKTRLTNPDLSSGIPQSGGSDRVRVALAGQPNAGKTALFNQLTGSNARVANFPGVTVESRDGEYLTAGKRFEVQDLPGTYSLSSFSPEERVAQQELLDSPPDVVVVVVDSTTLERSLMLLAQILLIHDRVVLCLNMADEARRAGQRLSIERMGELLGMPVVETVACKGEGTEQLRSAIDDVATRPPQAKRLVLGEQLRSALSELADLLREAGCDQAQQDWIGIKLLMGDPEVVADYSKRARFGGMAIARAKNLRERLEQKTGQDIALFITAGFAGFSDGLLRQVRTEKARDDARAVSDRIDRVLAHRVLGLPVFAAVMYAIFWATFSLGEVPMGWIESGFEALAAGIAGLWPTASESPLKSLLVDGVIGGVGGVIVFLPNILLLFFGLAILEDTGYMARAAHLVDNLMHRFGLHGKSFLPMVTGFGCSIPGIMATRTLENERDRLITMLVLPLMSCGARLPIWMLLIPAFFAPAWQAPVLWGIYTVGLVLALLLALLLRRTLFRGAESPFVMELPPYRLPTLRGLVAKMRERSWLYLRKAGTVILAISILMWFITAYPKPETTQLDRDMEAGRVAVVETGAAAHAPGVTRMSQKQADNLRAGEALQYSAAGRIGKAIEPLLTPIGLDWKLGTALVGAFAAKEVFVAQMGIVYSLGGADKGSEGLRNALARDYSPLTAFSLMLFLLIATPCMATVAITRRESGSWRWALLQFGGLTTVAWILSFIVYQVGSLFV